LPRCKVLILKLNLKTIILKTNRFKNFWRILKKFAKTLKSQKEKKNLKMIDIYLFKKEFVRIKVKLMR